MKIFQMVRSEFARLWATGMARIALVALMCVPLLYGGLYLWANQDPYARLNQIPVALVVDDTGSTSESSPRNLGEQVAESLIEDGSFAWKRVSAAEAEAGVEGGEFDFSVTFPADFTASLESSQGESPHQASVVLRTNDANSYLASTIGDQATKRIQAQIVQQVNREAAQHMLDGVAEIRVSLVKASDGAAQASSGATTLHQGLGQLRDGTAALPDQTARLAAGAEQVAAADARIAQIGRDVASASASITGRLDSERQAIADRLAAAGTDPATTEQILAAYDRVAASVRDVNDRAQGAQGQLNQREAGSSEVASGMRQLANATPQLAAGIASATDGAGQLASGVGELASGLASGVESIPNFSAELRSKQASNIADPVQVETSAVTSAGTYGAGLAPFFVSLAAWIGMYALFLILKPVSARAMTAMRTPVKVALAGWLTPTLLGAVQMLALFGIVAGTLGFKVAQPWGAYGMMLLASMTFAAIILALNVWLGSVGQFLGLILMVLQLVVAGGTFPWQTLPEPLTSLHHFMPMSFAVDGLRQLMYGGDLSKAGSDAIVLACVLLAALVLTSIGVGRMMRSRTMRDLQPSLIG